ncbi:MAG: threonylcarbamoyl-AMP synthase [Myxococcales bacterium]|nr:threonylcarbamoyl-AMP synthase [Myxococcales bacterium]
MNRLEPDRQGIERAVALLRAGEVVAIPTETVYGLAADAFDDAAVARVFEAKHRPSFDPMIVHVAPGSAREAVAKLARLDALNDEAGSVFDRLTTDFWPGPLTLVLPKARFVSDIVTAGLAHVAVRMPAHVVAQRLLEAFGGPLVAPSANRFGRISPTRAEHVVAELAGRVPAVLDGGPCEMGVESTIVGLAADGGLKLLRPGAVPVEALGSDLRWSTVDGAGGIEAPGQTDQHYSPATRCALLGGVVEEQDPATLRQLAADTEVALLRVVGDPASGRAALAAAGISVLDSRSLSPEGDLVQAARALFATLRELDDGSARRLLLEPPPSRRGLGHAIDDRLRRAAGSAR